MRKRTLTAVALVLSLVAVAPSAVAAAPVIGQQQEAPVAKVDVNRADEEQLQQVPGIGPSMARRIVEWRAEHGPFERIEDLLDIRGIGVKTLEKLRPYLTIGDEGPTDG